MLRVNRLVLVQSSCALCHSTEAELFGIDCYTFVEHFSIDFLGFTTTEVPAFIGFQGLCFVILRMQTIIFVTGRFFLMGNLQNFVQNNEKVINLHLFIIVCIRNETWK